MRWHTYCYVARRQSSLRPATGRTSIYFHDLHAVCARCCLTITDAFVECGRPSLSERRAGVGSRRVHAIIGDEHNRRSETRARVAGFPDGLTPHESESVFLVAGE
ncbi:hypothetical protein A0H81_05023 [Grifola frondosa]|uniref:Uncharacterized protein n=1 Tax=Grifola frondosa TaxID=5627 RepID=A0A1C7MEP6_GRIFR|nr:hypothetical protein A0H81_05023 [Grifola frondosa]